MALNHLPIWFQEGADINSRSDWNGTALYYAACNGHDQLIENILEKGAEADPKDNKGCKSNFFSPENSANNFYDYLQLHVFYSILFRWTNISKKTTNLKVILKTNQCHRILI